MGQVHRDLPEAAETGSQSIPRHPTKGAGDPREAVALWNEVAARRGLSQVSLLSPIRGRGLIARMAQVGGIEGWKAAMVKVDESPFLRGENPKGWRCTLDFVLKAEKFTRLMEGAYAHHKGTPDRVDQATLRLERLRALRGVTLENEE